MILDDIVLERKKQLLNEKAKISLDEILEKIRNIKTKTKNFYSALKDNEISIIAEVKKASPSKGIIAEDFDPVKIAKQYESFGASAISVLTEEKYFMGSGSYLEKIRENTSLPILRKDFIIDEYQIYEARLLGADAILLIASILDETTLKKFMDIAKGLGLYCLVEVHNKNELSKALLVGAKIIGINNRDLKTFKVDLEITKTLSKLIPKDVLIVSESGIDKSNIKSLKEIGIKSFLIGESLIKCPSIKEMLTNLRGKANDKN